MLLFLFNNNNLLNYFIFAEVPSVKALEQKTDAEKLEAVQKLVNAISNKGQVSLAKANSETVQKENFDLKELLQNLSESIAKSGKVQPKVAVETKDLLEKLAVQINSAAKVSNAATSKSLVRTRRASEVKDAELADLMKKLSAEVASGKAKSGSKIQESKTAEAFTNLSKMIGAKN